MAIGIEDRVVISPASWPSRATIAPGDLSKYAPIGLGLAGPMVVQPWGRPRGAPCRAGTFYGTADRSGDPFHDAPVNDAAGGLVYFDSGSDSQQLASMFTLLDVRDAVDRLCGLCVGISEPAAGPVPRADSHGRLRSDGIVRRASRPPATC